MELLQDAWNQLFQKPLPYTTEIKYSNHFSQYNANIRLQNSHLTLKLSRKWRNINHEITLGLVQSLLIRLFKKKINTINIDLYNNFVRNLHITIPKDKIDPFLEESFNRVNEKYFYSTIEIPNLVWGTDSRRKLGSYDFKSDTISMSTVFKSTPSELLDYVMYHEMLHKKHKYNHKHGRNLYHSTTFRNDEKAFPNAHQLEKELSQLGRKRFTSQSFLQKLLSF